MSPSPALVVLKAATPIRKTDEKEGFSAEAGEQLTWWMHHLGLASHSLNTR